MWSHLGLVIDLLFQDDEWWDDILFGTLVLIPGVVLWILDNLNLSINDKVSRGPGASDEISGGQLVEAAEPPKVKLLVAR